ncbi:MAG: M56 family metallopeptidase [Myxococcota bacterium]
MNTFVAATFNLLLNAVGSFLPTLALVAGVLWLVRIPPGNLRLSLWLLPFVKVLWDLLRGIPASSFVWVHAVGAKQDIGSFMVGVGLGPTPRIHAVLNAHSSGISYPQSAADILYRALEHKVSPWAPACVVVALLSVTFWRLGRRWRLTLQFRREARKWLTRATPLSTARSWGRNVTVYVSAEHAGPPFAAGVVHPFVLFSQRAWSELDADARDAALSHELSHLDRHDPALIAALLLFCDVFWFLPGRAWLARRVLAEIEFCADQRAVRRGVAPEVLANALVSVAEQMAPSRVAMTLSLTEHVLRERVEHLLRPRSLARRWRRALLHALVWIGLVTLVTSSVFLGN